MGNTEDTTTAEAEKAKAKAKAKDKKPQHPRDPAREVVETIVFVVVLVLLLKLFVTEAFVIPTGSMAETLYGYQKLVICPKCGHEFPVNANDEVEGRQGDKRRLPVVGFCCPNCRYLGQIREIEPPPKNRTGDRVLVLKPLFHIRDPERGDVVVFKFPEEPQKNYEAANYIKRAMGFGGETIAIYRGDLFATKFLDYPADLRDEDTGELLYPRPESPLDLWKPRFMYSNSARHGNRNPHGLALFKVSHAAGFPVGKNGFGSSGFEIVRKGEAQVKADARVVWDNDHQPDELVGKVPTRWYIPGDSKGWQADNAAKPKSFSHSGMESWIRYRHLPMQWKTTDAVEWDPIPPTEFAELARQQPTYIDNFLGYNAGREYDPQTGKPPPQFRDTSAEKHWVGDLLLECEATLGGDGEVSLELSKGVNRCRATFGGGKVTLSRTGPGSENFGNPSRPCKVAQGKYKIRFANVDCRLWVWVDDKLIDFGTEGDYPPPTPQQEEKFEDMKPNADGNLLPAHGVQQPEGWTYKNDVAAPAGIGAKGEVTVRAVKLMRDVYYTHGDSRSDPALPELYYVQPGHYLCLGDNSAQSSDSRMWGTVPERLMLGKAVFVFFPVGRVGFIK
jgi:signal peptidase I